MQEKMFSKIKIIYGLKSKIKRQSFFDCLTLVIQSNDALAVPLNLEIIGLSYLRIEISNNKLNVVHRLKRKKKEKREQCRTHDFLKCVNDAKQRNTRDRLQKTKKNQGKKKNECETRIYYRLSLI